MGTHFLSHSNPVRRFPGHISAGDPGMSTTPSANAGPVRAPGNAAAGSQALVPASPSPEAEAIAPYFGRATRLPVEVDVAIPLKDFRVRNLLALESGAVVESQWVHGDDVPLGSRDVQLAWSEFEVVDTRLAVRLTRLA
jgi:flagellar motor switch/type III secretory pathway protein FliN